MKKMVIISLVVSLFTLMIALQSFGGGDVTKGRIVYEAFCINCHGVTGGGDGPNAAALNPKPTNLTDKAATSNLTPQDIERAVVMGKPDTAMKGYGGILTKEDIEDLFAYLNTLMGK